MTKKELNTLLAKLEEAKNSCNQAITEACEASAYASQAETQALEAHDIMIDIVLMLEEINNDVV